MKTTSCTAPKGTDKNLSSTNPVDNAKSNALGGRCREHSPLKRVGSVIHTVMRKLVPATMMLTAVGFSNPTLLKIVAELQ